MNENENPQAVAPFLAARIGAVLGIDEAAAAGRLARLAAHFGEAHGLTLLQAAKRTNELSLRELMLLLAEGHGEQALALSAPEEVRPGTHGGLGGHVETPEESGS